MKVLLFLLVFGWVYLRGHLSEGCLNRSLWAIVLNQKENKYLTFLCYRWIWICMHVFNLFQSTCIGIRYSCLGLALSKKALANSWEWTEERYEVLCGLMLATEADILWDRGSHNIVGSDPGLSWPDYCQPGLAVLSSLAVRAVCHVRGETVETGHQWQVTSRHNDTITSFRKVLKVTQHSNNPVQFPG